MFSSRRKLVVQGFRHLALFINNARSFSLSSEQFLTPCMSLFVVALKIISVSLLHCRQIRANISLNLRIFHWIILAHTQLLVHCRSIFYTQTLITADFLHYLSQSEFCLIHGCTAEDHCGLLQLVDYYNKFCRQKRTINKSM